MKTKNGQANEARPRRRRPYDKKVDCYLLILIVCFVTGGCVLVPKVDTGELINLRLCDNLGANMNSTPSNDALLSALIQSRDGAKYPFWIHCYVNSNNEHTNQTGLNNNSYTLSNLTYGESANNGSQLHPSLSIRDDRYEYLVSVAQTCEPYLLKRCRSFRLGLLSQETSKCPTCGLGDSNCDKVHQCTSECGQIKSSNYPFNYNNNHRCRWSIRAPDSFYVNLSIIDFDIPSSSNATELGTCIFDYLTLLDGYTGKRLGGYCNENLPPPYIVSPWNELIIQFDTNSETTGRGFYFQYEFMKLRLNDQIERLLKPPTTTLTEGSNATTGLSLMTNNNTAVCPDGWQYFRGSCYKAFNELEPLQWYDAERKCHSHGEGLDGHLVSILDKDEMLVIHHFMTNVWRSARYRNYYIGLIDISREGVYRWSDNNPMSYTDWELKPMLLEEETPAQPDGGAYEDCTIIRFNSYSRTSNWHDVPCSLGKHYHSNNTEKGNQFGFKWVYVNSYICKSDSISIGNATQSKVRRRLFSNEFIPYLIQSGHLIKHLAGSSNQNVNRNTARALAKLNKATKEDPQLQRRLQHNSNNIDSRLPLLVTSNQNLTTDYNTTISNNNSITHVSRFYLSMLDSNRYFVCDNLEVISVVFRCDGIAHCRDGSDESNDCDEDCLDWQFKCANGRCISFGSYCNFVDDCGDNSDESRCERLRCKLNEFRCSNGQCIMAQQQCDLLTDCSDASDERRCGAFGSNCSSASTFRCYSGNCIPHYAVCDFQIDCPGKFNEDEDAMICDVILKNRSLDYKFYAASTNYHNSPVAFYQVANQLDSASSWIKQNLFKCTSGNMIDKNLRCLYEIDRYGYQTGCRDVSHLIDCADFECPARDYVKCANSYCIPWRYICDGKWDCMMGEDEIGCSRYVCPGQYKCANQSSCILLHQLCDGQRQCPMGDDEWFCDLKCPMGCDCIGQWVNCQGANLTSLPSNHIAKTVRKLDLSHNKLGPNLSNSDFSAYHDLGELILHHNEIEVLIPRKFHQLKNLYKLDLSYNQIHSVKRGAFVGLRRVTQLLLESNPELVVLEPEAFSDMQMLQMLNISSSRILALRKKTFHGLTSLRHLLLRSNMIVQIEDGAFGSLGNLVSLDMRGNEIRYFTKSVFSELKSLRNLSTDSFKFCCLMNHQIPADRCLPLPDEISDCEDLLSSVKQSVWIWITGVIACASNLFVIGYRYRHLRGSIKEREIEQINSTLLLSLGCADLLMGIYLITIASADSWFRGKYIENADNWRESGICQMCGFLSTISIEVSVFTLVCIAYNRYTEICKPFNSPYKLTPQWTIRLTMISWSSALVIATLPLLIKPYFKGQFYTRSGICLAFHITNQKVAGWLYSMLVFQGFYLVALLIIVTCYWFIYLEGSRSSVQSRPNFGWKISLILVTSFIAWSPTIIFRLISFAGVALPPTYYSWIALLVLPVTPAINPMIYTIPSIWRYGQLLIRNHRARKSGNLAAVNRSLLPYGVGHQTISGAATQNNPGNNNLMNKGQVPLATLTNIGKNLKQARNVPPGYMPLKDYILNSREMKADQLAGIALKIACDVETKHHESRVYASLILDNIFVSDTIETSDDRPTGECKLSVFIADHEGYHLCNHRASHLIHSNHRRHTSNWCECSDVKKFRDILLKMIQLYNTRRSEQQNQHQVENSNSMSNNNNKANGSNR